jgi:hypothetical protein
MLYQLSTTEGNPMNRNARARTSYANAVSTLALVVAVIGGGTAVAAGLASNSVESRHIVDGTVRSTDVRDGSVTGKDVDETSLDTVPIAEAAASADEALSAGHAETASRLLGSMRASVTAAGALRPNQSIGAVSAEQTSTPGRYVVTFGSPMLGCFLMAGVAHNSTDRVSGSASAWITPFAANPGANKVTVETHTPGLADSVPDPAPFTLVVDCQTGS